MPISDGYSEFGDDFGVEGPSGFPGGYVTKWQYAEFVFDWGLILYRGGAIVSQIRGASYIRRGYKVVKEAPKGGKLTALEAFVVGRPIRSALFAGGSLGTVAMHPATNPLYYQIQIGADVNTYVIGQYIDREGRIRTFLPSGQILSGLGGYNATSRTGTEARSFYDMNGLGLLKSMGTPTPETFEEASESRKRTPARRRSRSDSSKPPAPAGV